MKVQSALLNFCQSNLFFVSIVSFAVAFHLFSGPVESLDTITFYKWAENLIVLNWDSLKLVEDYSGIHSILNYLLPINLFAISISIFGENSTFAILFLNIFCMVSIFYFFKAKMLLLGVSRFSCNLATAFLILFSGDILIWPRYILTDTLFVFILSAFYLFLLRSYLEKRKMDHLKFVIFCIILVFSRPTFTPFLGTGIIFYILCNVGIKNISLSFFSVFFGLALSLSCLAFLALFGLDPKPIDNHSISWLEGWVKDGVVIHDRPNTYVLMGASNHFLELGWLYVKRILYFFAFFSEDWSISHKIINSMWMTSFILSSIYMVIFFKETKREWRLIFLFFIGTIFAVSLFQAFIFIDFDWRYRYPTIIPMGILIAMAIHTFSLKLSTLKKG